MPGKKKKKEAALQKALRTSSQQSIPFILMGSELLALQKAVRGYQLLVETLPYELEGRAEMLALLHSLSQRLQSMLLSNEDCVPAIFPGLEISIANDAMRVYLAAASSFTGIAQRTAPLEERHITALLVPLQQRFQVVVSQIKPKGMISFFAEKSSLN